MPDMPVFKASDPPMAYIISNDRTLVGPIVFMETEGSSSPGPVLCTVSFFIDERKEVADVRTKRRTHCRFCGVEYDKAPYCRGC